MPINIKLGLDDPRSLLYAVRLPGTLYADQSAALLGLQAHDIPPLVKARLLKPLGGALRNHVKRFSSASIERCRLDERWLEKAAKAIMRGRPAQRQPLLADLQVPGREHVAGGQV